MECTFTKVPKSAGPPLTPRSYRDAANLFKPALARGQLRLIGATTLAEYREHIEKDGALDRRFAQVQLPFTPFRILSHICL